MAKNLTLREYLDLNGGVYPLAEKTGVAPSTIYRMMSGQRSPRLRTAMAIHLATNKRVRLDSLLNLGQPERVA